MPEPKDEVNEFAAEVKDAEVKASAEDIASKEAEVKDAFGDVKDDNAFGLKEKAEVVKEDKPDEKLKEEKPADTKPEDKSAEAKAEEVKDELLEKLKEKSPYFKELCEKKGYKDADSALKAYSELEKLHGQKANQLSTYRKGLEKYCTFDEEGNINGYTELGKKAIATGQELPPPNQEIKPNDILSAEQVAQLEQIKDKFFDMFEKNPIEAIIRIAMGVTQHNLKGHKDEFSKSFEDLNKKLGPIFEEREDKKMLSLIDDVAKEQVASGDAKANEFIDEYAPEIEAELKKISLDLRKSNPKLAIQQAYLIVKDKKVQEWQKQMKEKQDLEQKKKQAEAESGAQGGGGAEPEEAPEITGMVDALKSKSDGSIFF